MDPARSGESSAAAAGGGGRPRASALAVAPALRRLLVEATEHEVEQDRREHAADDARQHVAAGDVADREARADEDAEHELVERLHHSHSIVPGGLDVMSSTTRLTSRISPI